MCASFRNDSTSGGNRKMVLARSRDVSSADSAQTQYFTQCSADIFRRRHPIVVYYIAVAAFTFRCLLKVTKVLLTERYCTRNFSEDRFPFV